MQGKHCIVNVQNYDDKCFVWAILSAIHPPSLPNAQYRSELKTDDLVFPITTKNIPKFESMNPQISVNVLAFGSNEREFCIEYLSDHRDRAQHVNLFVIVENGKHHNVWIKNMSKLVAGRTKRQNATHVCNSCLHPFCDKIVLERHIPYCLRHPPQVVKYPNPENEDECTVKFRGHHKQHHIPFYLVCDFESFLSPANDEEVNNSRGTHVIHEYHVTPINSEKYIMFEIGKLRFIDSFQFLSTSLENLVSILLKSGKDTRANIWGTTRWSLQKGFIPIRTCRREKNLTKPNYHLSSRFRTR